MENRSHFENICELIKNSNDSYETTVPEHLLSRLESKLDAGEKPKKFPLQNLAAYAAISLSIAASLFILLFHLKERNTIAGNGDFYAMEIQPLNGTHHKYPVYDIHQLMRAYQNIHNTESEVNEIRYDHNLRVLHH